MTQSTLFQKKSRLVLLLCLLCAMAMSAQAQVTNLYSQTNLVSDGFVPARTIDPKLVNPWGIAVCPFLPNVVADNGSGVTTSYLGDGTKVDTFVTIPPPRGATGPSAPTGAVFNPYLAFDAFLIRNGRCPAEPAAFIYATEDGTIAAVSLNPAFKRAVVMVDNSLTTAVYKGIAIAADGDVPFLFATDFHNARIDVFDRFFRRVTLPAGAFTDPNLPAGFAPFGIQNILGNLFVTYAKQDAAKHDDVAGPGLGFVDVYDVRGRLLRRFAAQGTLNAPWGLALAPDNFGLFSDALLVGNFGDGTINAFDLDNGAFLGQLHRADGSILQINSLWGIAFGNGVFKQPINTLFFAAGVGDEAHGLYGRIEAVLSPPATVKARKK